MPLTRSESKPKVEKAGSTWWVNWTETHQGQEVQKGRPYSTWGDAIGWALYLADCAKAAAA